MYRTKHPLPAFALKQPSRQTLRFPPVHCCPDCNALYVSLLRFVHIQACEGIMDIELAAMNAFDCHSSCSFSKFISGIALVGWPRTSTGGSKRPFTVLSSRSLCGTQRSRVQSSHSELKSIRRWSYAKHGPSIQTRVTYHIAPLGGYAGDNSDASGTSTQMDCYFTCYEINELISDYQGYLTMFFSMRMVGSVQPHAFRHEDGKR